MGLMMLGRLKYHQLSPVPLEVEMAFEKLKRCKSSGTDPFSAEQIQAAGRKTCSEIHKHII
jgi:hypothetical protein